MQRASVSTAKTRRLAVILVNGSAAFAVRCREAAGRAGAILRDCTMAMAPATTADWQPLAIILTDAVYGAHAAELEALARSVSASLLRLANEEVSQDELDGRLRAVVEELDRS